MTATLFEYEAAAPEAAPRCRMCARPARWNKVRQEWSTYCAGAACSNRERICQMCGEAFVIKVDGAGTKYCSAACRSEAQAPTKARGVPCAGGCGRTGVQRGAVWPYTCDKCLAPIHHLVDRLKSHHVSHARAMQLVADPTCEVCGTDIVAKVPTGHGKHRALLVVDHDHSCCPGDSHSCGQCVRGLICRACNVAAGQLRDDPAVASALAGYLARVTDS